MNYKLSTNQHYLLCEALRRYTRFNLLDLKYPLDKAWTGLGSYTTYKPALNANLMTYIHEPNPRCIQWWKLTEKGAAIVQNWLDEGFDYHDIEANNLPPLREETKA